MRIVGGHIDRFGFYQDQDLPELQQGLVLVVGDNESGKTTLLEFIRQTLFGYKEARQHPYYDSGAPPSGNLDLVLANGEARTIARRGARGAAKLLDSAGNPRPSPELDAILGGMTDEGFRNLFAITLDELRALDSQEQADIEALLLGASFGVSPEAYNRAVKELDAEARSLLTIRGANQPANAAAIAYGKATTEARRIGDVVAQFSDKAQNLEQLRNRVEELEDERARTMARSSRAARLVEAWPAWVEVRRQRDALDALPQVPEHDYGDAVRTYEAARAEIEETLETLAKAEAIVARATRERDAHSPDEALLEEGPAIRTAIADLSGWREARQRADQERADAATVRRELDDTLGQLDLPKDDEGLQRALALQTGVQATNLLTQARRRLETSEGEAAEARRAHEQAKREAEKAQEEVRRAEAELPEPPPEPAIPEERLRVFQERRVQARTAAREAEARRTAIESQRRDLERELVRTAPDWRLGDLAGFDPVAARRAVAPASDRLSEAESDARQAARSLEAAQSSAQAATRQLAEAQDEARAAAPDIDSLDAAEERLELVRQARSACESAEAEAAAAHGGSGRSPLGLGLTVASLAAFMVAAGLFAADVPGGAVVAAVVGVLLLLVGVGLLLRTPDEPTTRPAARRRDQLLRQLGLAEPPRSGVFERQIEALEGARRAFLQTEERATRARMAQEEVEAASVLKQEAHRARDEARRALDQVFDALRVPPSARDDALGFVLTLDRLCGEAQRIERDEAEAARHQDAWRTFADEVRALDSTVPEDAGPDAVDAAAETLVQSAEAFVAARDERLRKEEWIQDRRAISQGLRQEEELRRAEAESAAERFSGARTAWRKLLRKQGFETGLDPEGAKKAQELAGEVRKLHSRRVEADKRTAATQAAIREFEKRCGELLSRLGRPVPEGSALEPALRALADALQESVDAKAARDKAHADLEAARESTRELKTRIDTRRRRQAELLEAAGCPDFEGLQQRAATAKERDALHQRIEELRSEALAKSGEVDENRLAEAMEGEDLESLERGRETLQTRVREIEDERDKTIEQRTELDMELSRLRGEEGREKHLAMAEAHRAEARAAARKWLRARLALWMLEEARRTFERDHQPRVLVEAGKLLAAITDGRWTRISRSVEGGGDLAVHAGHGAGTAAAILSRGAREQLYFALRLANALQPRAKGEPLPLVLDDVLVNFDEDRARKSLRALASAARERQILLFTCHDWVRGLVEKQATAAQVVRLTSGEFVEV